MVISLKANNQSFGPPLASKTRCVLSNPLGFSPYPTGYKKGPLKRGLSLYGGGIGIRTLDTLLTYASFQDWCIQPLCHPTVEGAIIQRLFARTSTNYSLDVFSLLSFADPLSTDGLASDFSALRFFLGSFDARTTLGLSAATGAGALVAAGLGCAAYGRSVLTSTALTGLGFLRGSLLALTSPSSEGLASLLTAAGFSLGAAFFGSFSFICGSFFSAVVFRSCCVFCWLGCRLSARARLAGRLIFAFGCISCFAFYFCSCSFICCCICCTFNGISFWLRLARCAFTLWLFCWFLCCSVDGRALYWRCCGFSCCLCCYCSLIQYFSWNILALTTTAGSATFVIGAFL